MSKREAGSTSARGSTQNVAEARNKQIKNALRKNWPKLFQELAAEQEGVYKAPQEKSISHSQSHSRTQSQNQGRIAKPTLLPSRHLPNLTGKKWNDVYKNMSVEICPELYLTTIVNLCYYDPKREPGRRSAPDFARPQQNTKSSALDQRLVQLADTFSSIIVGKPKGNVLALMLVRDGKSNPKMYIGGNWEVDPKVKAHLLEVWHTLQQISEQYKPVHEGGGIDEPSPKRVVKDKDGEKDYNEILTGLKRKLLTMLVEFSKEKIKHRIKKYIKTICEIVEEKSCIGWDNTGLGNSIRKMCQTFYDIATDDGEGAVNIGGELYEMLASLQNLDFDSKSKGAAPADLWLNEAQAELKSSQIRKFGNFSLMRYCKKCFAIVVNFNALLKFASSWRLKKDLLNFDLDVEFLQPQARQIFGELNAEHIRLVIARSYLGLKIDEDSITEKLVSKTTMEMLYQMNLLEASPKTSPHRSSTGADSRAPTTPKTLGSFASGPQDPIGVGGPSANTKQVGNVTQKLATISLNHPDPQTARSQASEDVYDAEETLKDAIRVRMLYAGAKAGTPEQGVVEKADAFVLSSQRSAQSITGYKGGLKKSVGSIKNNKQKTAEIVEKFEKGYDHFGGKCPPENRGETKSTAGQGISDRGSPLPQLSLWKQIPVHYECLVLAKAYELLKDPNKSRPYQYIGVGKLNCIFCAYFFKSYCESVPRVDRFFTRGSHQRAYDAITTPCLGAEIDKKIEVTFIERLERELVRQFDAAQDDIEDDNPKRSSRRYSESTIETAGMNIPDLDGQRLRFK